MRAASIAVAVLAALGAVLAAAAAGGDAGSNDDHALATPPGGFGPEIVDALVVAPEGDRSGYDRDRFAHWVDADGDGCDTRCEVLAEERHATLPGLPGGGWRSPYDGYTTPDPGELEIDHVVALAEAWDSGAAAWDDDRRRAFANDLDEPDALVAVTAATNRSKADRDPASWQPPSDDAWCGYARAWVRVKVRWGLTADEAEARALRNMLAGCGRAPAG